jgi:hypothetical protein
MRRVGGIRGSDGRRGIAAAMALAFLVLGSSMAAAKNAKIDRDRASASLTLAAHYWVQGGLDKLPSAYERARFEKAIQGEEEPYNIISGIAAATLNANPGRKDTVFRYLNESLLPFATTHKAQYLCLVAEVFYNSQDSTDALRAMAKGGPSSHSVPIAFIDYAYYLIKTEPARDKLKLVLPADNGIPETVAAFKKMLTPKGGSLIPETAVKLDCDHQPGA